jgi:hypothetical protein
MPISLEPLSHSNTEPPPAVTAVVVSIVISFTAIYKIYHAFNAFSDYYNTTTSTACNITFVAICNASKQQCQSSPFARQPFNRRGQEPCHPIQTA